ncbi:MAG TPA: HAD hydrolase family protein [Candidatus Omnitrophota bacterium]|nr:HAD hydrolase family protein [Candidatus Omnitrophota bacterium]HQJ15192.1 HAD hydrolase family protein [Candidatus Omnitrophota bacterium]
MVNRSVIEKAKKVKVLLLDVDGVLTDGRIVYDSSGRNSKFYDVHDGMGVHLLHTRGIPTVLISAKRSAAIGPRARDMHVDRVYENIKPKTAVLDDIKKRYGVGPAEMCFVGDDLVDICLMRKVGLPIAVANACDEVKASAAWVTSRQGGRGAVREVSEMILKAQGQWLRAIRPYEE